MDLFCAQCNAVFPAKRKDKKFCSVKCSSKESYRRRKGMPTITERGRDCKCCGKHFAIEWPDSNRRYCSFECAKKGANKATREFRERNKSYNKLYREAHPRVEVGGRVARMRRKYPNLPTACQACGESRVVEVAHRPEFRHRGGTIGMNIQNREPHMIWILCPTCHKLLDRGICTPRELGLS